MLILSCLAAFVLAIGLIFLIDMSSIYINHQSLSDRTDRLTLEAASALNEGDRAGRLNHLIIQCRDMISRNRKAYALTEVQPFVHFRPLCWQLLDQSRHGAALLEQERQRLVSTRLMEIKTRLHGYYQPPSVTTAKPQVVVDEIDVGTVKGFSSGVPSALVEPDLKENDIKERYIDKKTGLYAGEINARMPGEDSDLTFKLCALPKLDKESSLQRGADYKQYGVLVNDGKEQAISCDQMPASVVLKASGSFKGMIFQQNYHVGTSAMANTAGPAFQ
jgi:hypothetical protein